MLLCKATAYADGDAYEHPCPLGTYRSSASDVSKVKGRTTAMPKSKGSLSRRLILTVTIHEPLGHEMLTQAMHLRSLKEFEV